MPSPAECVILVPMLGRAHRVEPLLASLKATGDFPVLFLTTPGDDEVINAVEKAASPMLTVPHRPRGDYARKINHGYRHTTQPLLFLAADDLHFHSGWFEAATAKLTSGIGVVGTNDKCNRRTIRGEHSTHSLVTRQYADRGLIDRPGLLYEGYPHEYVDDELVGTAKHRDAYAHAHDSIVEHLHPMARKAPMDELYAAQAQRMRSGRSLYEKRRRLWM